MRFAIVSDIHSNLPALSSVKEAVERLGVEAVICAGDTVGYGANPNECCQVIAGWALVSCIGNHDLAALRRDPAGMNPYAAKAALWTSEHLDEDSKAYLSGLEESARLRMDEIDFEIHHGSLRSIWEYLYEDDATERMLSEALASVLVFGHTHVPYVKRYPAGIIVNPGSVGQPRDNDPRASLAILSTDPLMCETIRVEYDIEAASEAILREGLPTMLAERLYSGH